MALPLVISPCSPGAVLPWDPLKGGRGKAVPPTRVPDSGAGRSHVRACRGHVRGGARVGAG